MRDDDQVSKKNLMKYIGDHYNHGIGEGLLLLDYLPDSDNLDIREF